MTARRTRSLGRSAAPAAVNADSVPTVAAEVARKRRRLTLVMVISWLFQGMHSSIARFLAKGRKKPKPQARLRACGILAGLTPQARRLACGLGFYYLCEYMAS